MLFPLESAHGTGQLSEQLQMDGARELTRLAECHLEVTPRGRAVCGVSCVSSPTQWAGVDSVLDTKSS